MDKGILFHKKFGFYLQNLIFIHHDTINHIEYYSNYNKIDLYKFDIQNHEWSFIYDGVKKIVLHIQ